VRAVPVVYTPMNYHSTLPVGSVMEGLWVDETRNTDDASGYVELL
jgi:hypothetical protein